MKWSKEEVDGPSTRTITWRKEGSDASNRADRTVHQRVTVAHEQITPERVHGVITRMLHASFEGEIVDALPESSKAAFAKQCVVKSSRSAARKSRILELLTDEERATLGADGGSPMITKWRGIITIRLLSSPKLFFLFWDTHAGDGAGRGLQARYVRSV